MVLEGGAVSYERGTPVLSRPSIQETGMREEPEKLREAVRKVDVRLPGKGNSNSHVARPVHQIIAIIRWFWTSRLSIKDSLSLRSFQNVREAEAASWETLCASECITGVPRS